MFEPVVSEQKIIIKVIGVGGGGSNAVDYMYRNHIEGVDYCCINTDVQALERMSVPTTIQIGCQRTKGLGAGANPEVGRESAEEDREKIKAFLKGSDMVFIAAGMGGGTGTGAAPVVAELAKELGALTVGVVTKPFPFEGGRRSQFAEQGINALSEVVDSLITIPNGKLLPALGEDVTVLRAYEAANDVLYKAAKGIAEVITVHGMVNVDFADVRSVMSEMGSVAMMGIGQAEGPDQAEIATEMAISSPLLDDIDLTGARGVLAIVTGGLDMRLKDLNTVGEIVRSFASESANIIIGQTFDENMAKGLRVTIVATGIDDNNQSKIVNKSKRVEVQNQHRPIIMNKPSSMSSTMASSVHRSSSALKQDRQVDKEEEFQIPSYVRNPAD